HAPRGHRDPHSFPIRRSSDLPVAVVRLETDHYMHKKWGKTYTPIFDIVKWIALEDEAEAAEAAATEAPKETPAPARSRTRSETEKPSEDAPAKAEPTADDRRAALLAELERLEK